MSLANSNNRIRSLGVQRPYGSLTPVIYYKIAFTNAILFYGMNSKRNRNLKSGCTTYS